MSELSVQTRNGGAARKIVPSILDVLSQRWTLHILTELLKGRRRFNEMSRERHINPNTLRDRLRELEHSGIVSRTVVSTMPPNVEYALTEKGQSLAPVVELLVKLDAEWDAEHGRA